MSAITWPSVLPHTQEHSAQIGSAITMELMKVIASVYGRRQDAASTRYPPTGTAANAAGSTAPRNIPRRAHARRALATRRPRR